MQTMSKDEIQARLTEIESKERWIITGETISERQYQILNELSEEKKKLEKSLIALGGTENGND